MIRSWFRPPRHVLAIFLVVAIVSAGALAWLMMMLLQQDKDVENQRRQEHVAHAADHAAESMRAALISIENLLNARPDEPSKFPPGVLGLHVRSDGIVVEPNGHLLYYPEPAKRNSALEAPFEEIEQMESPGKEPRRAAEQYAQLAANSDRAVRAGALARLARVQRKMHNPAAAIDSYVALSQFADESVFGLPADLVAHEGKASVLEELHRTPELHAEAVALKTGLHSGRWKLSKAEYGFRLEEVGNWLGKSEVPEDADAVAQAEAAGWMSENRQALTGEKPILRPTVAGPALILSRTETSGVSTAVASPSYLKSLCRSALDEKGLECTLSDMDGHPLLGKNPTGALMVTRQPAETQLPWTLQIFAAPDTAGVSPQGRLLWWVAGVLTVVWLTGAAFIVRAMQREARVAQLQSDFVAAISHEFRSPLSSLCQISEMLASERFDSDEMRYKSYGVLVRESSRLRNLVEDLLDFGRFESGASIYHFELLEMRTFLKPLIADFQHRVEQDGFSIEFREPEKEIYVRADREALSRAIRNLLDNAVKYSPDCHTVWVELERETNRVLIAVRDQGLGVPLAEQQRIFERFVRGADSKARRIKGTGIGLAMVRHIVQAHGGEIVLTSKQGEGSRFTMVLPEGVKS